MLTQADLNLMEALSNDKLTWRQDLPTQKCENCGEQFYASQESINANRANDPDDSVSDKDIASGFVLCLTCTGDTNAPRLIGEHVKPFTKPRVGDKVWLIGDDTEDSIDWRTVTEVLTQEHETFAVRVSNEGDDVFYVMWQEDNFGEA